MNFQTFKLIPIVAVMSVGCSKGGPEAEQASSDDSSMNSDSDDSSMNSDSDDSSLGSGPVQDVQTGKDLPTPSEPGGPSRPGVTEEECTTQGGQIIGDIGDGAVYQEAYMCPSGTPPIGNIVTNDQGPARIEGAVCCQ